MYKFNPQHIAALSGGKVILAHTKKEEDLPLLRAVIKETFPNCDWFPQGKHKYYFKDQDNEFEYDWSNEYEYFEQTIIIPLHDFLAKDELPKEDLDRIDKIDKDLQELKAILKVNGYTIAPKQEPDINYSVQVAYIYEGYYGIEIGDLNGVMNKDQANQTAALIRWVLDNQETVLKLKKQ